MVLIGLTAPLLSNPASAIVKDGVFLAAAEEERFNGIKHSPRIFPIKSLLFCLNYAKVNPSQIDAIALSYRPPISGHALSIYEDIKEFDFKRIIRDSASFLEYLINVTRLREELERIGVNFNKTKIYFIPHHLAHAASAYRCSGFSKTNILTIDGKGEDDSGMLAMGVSGKINKIEKIPSYQSLGWLYSEVTELLGFKGHSHEGKVMGLAGWGRDGIDFNKYWETGDNWFELRKDWNKQLWKKFGPKRPRNFPLNSKHKNIAYMTQNFIEKAGVALARRLYEKTKIGKIALAGGVALNCDMNGKIWQLPFTENIFIQPAAHDAGTAIGAVLELASNYKQPADFQMNHAYWGPEYKDEQIKAFLNETKIPYKKIDKVEEPVAKDLAGGKIVGWFQGRSEIGPRALGNRSILAHPGIKGMKNKINKNVKHREIWRPFAPAILHEYGSDYFCDYCLNPFMTLTFSAKEKAKKELSQAIHIDNTARVQSVTKENNKRFYALIKEFQKKTSIPALLNTSFNDSEQPLVNNPKDAFKVFTSTGIDVLVMGNFIIRKDDL